MTSRDDDRVGFDDVIEVALAGSVPAATPSPRVRSALLARVMAEEPPPPPGFAFRFAATDTWLPHPVPGIRMRVLSKNDARGYATLLLDVAPGTHFPPHHHGGAEECYVISGSVYSCGRRFGPGDFLHADADTDHGELYTDEHTQVLLIVQPDDYIPSPAAG